MAVTKFLSRAMKFYISTAPGVDTIAGTADDTWTQIKGLNSRSHSDSSTDAETTGDDSDGASEHMVAERAESWTISGFKLLDTTTGDQDPGQEAVEELAREVGPDSIGHIKIEFPGGAAEIFPASAKLTKPGGGHNDPGNWAVTLRKSGVTTYVPA
jgi:hypothetical protein